MSLKTIQTITLDFTVPKIKNVRCVQDDINTRYVHIIVTNNGQPFPLDKNTMIARYKIHKPDCKYIYNEVPINDDGTVTINLTDQAVAVTGICNAELQISNSSEIISTMPFNIIVEKSVVNSNDIKSETESTVIDSFLIHLSDFNNPHRIPDATTTVKGITTLTDSTSSTSTTTAATPNSVKKTYDALVNSDNAIISHADIDALFV